MLCFIVSFFLVFFVLFYIVRLFSVLISRFVIWFVVFVVFLGLVFLPCLLFTSVCLLCHKRRSDRARDERSSLLDIQTSTRTPLLTLFVPLWAPKRAHQFRKFLDSRVLRFKMAQLGGLETFLMPAWVHLETLLSRLAAVTANLERP